MLKPYFDAQIDAPIHNIQRCALNPILMPELMLPIYYAHAAYLTPCVEISILMLELIVPIFYAL